MIGRIVLAAALAAALSACGEKPQTAATKKSDAKPWEGVQKSHVAQGWKAGDKDSWEAQMRVRAQNQNEYTRNPPRP
ncbi:hypothetical protein FSC37_04390 [Piscinibacter aquaticus]|uniref:Lipoprotein n=1 Tax=Piscinibacter aquaticus TaxID=392597 RepID=A0A5C6TY87_9BURK|nr:hypothetical protein FSC37_04390 [Piscinibacter aquaticus]